MRTEVLCWMTKGSARKPVTCESVKKLLELDGWVAELNGVAKKDVEIAEVIKSTRQKKSKE